jgi:hypothetical protein
MNFLITEGTKKIPSQNFFDSPSKRNKKKAMKSPKSTIFVIYHIPSTLPLLLLGKFRPFVMRFLEGIHVITRYKS